jgi:hypothetical protein
MVWVPGDIEGSAAVVMVKSLRSLAAGEIRGDLELAQILDMVGAIAKIHGDPSYVDPILSAALAGLST